MSNNERHNIRMHARLYHKQCFSLKVHKDISNALNIFCGIFIFPLTASIQFLLPGNKILMNKIQINTSKAIRKQKKT